jgi:hypothetical protein
MSTSETWGNNEPGWLFEDTGVVPGRILFRHVFNDVVVTPWKPIIDFMGTTDQELREYLTREYGEDPQLKRGTTFSPMITEDRFSYQYWGVIHTSPLLEDHSKGDCCRD